MSDNKLVLHTGGCHCGTVRFQVSAPEHITVYDCNCSICEKKQNIHFIVPHSRFNIIQGEDSLSIYQFGTRQAKHMFCKICGVQSFYQPRSNPNGYGVMPHCLDPGTVRDVTVVKFDGDNWENSMKKEEQKPDSIHKWSNESA